MLSALGIAAALTASAASAGDGAGDGAAAAAVMSLWEQRALDDVPALAAATYEHWRSLLTPAEARVHDAVVRTSDSEMAAAQARSRLLERRRRLSQRLDFGSRSACEHCHALVWRAERSKCCGNGRFVLRPDDCPQLPEDAELVRLLTHSVVMEYSNKLNSQLAVTAVGTSPTKAQEGRGFHRPGTVTTTRRPRPVACHRSSRW
jgi:hypothetical protein